MASSPLFRSKGDLADFLDDRKGSLKKEVEGLDSNYILNVSKEDVCQSLISKYSLELIALHTDRVYVADQREIKIDVSNDPQRFIVDRSGPVYVAGIQVRIAFPFDGDGELFEYRPSTFTYSPPSGEISGQELHLIYEMTENDPNALKKMYETDLQEVNRYVEWVNNQVKNFNDSLGTSVREEVARRKKRLLDGMNLIASLGIPVKKREDLPTTYAVPAIRKEARDYPRAKPWSQPYGRMLGITVFLTKT